MIDGFAFFAATIVALVVGAAIGRLFAPSRQPTTVNHVHMDDRTASNAIVSAVNRFLPSAARFHEVETEYWKRGSEIAKLSRRLGKARASNRKMHATIAELRRQNDRLNDRVNELVGELMRPIRADAPNRDAVGRDDDRDYLNPMDAR